MKKSLLGVFCAMVLATSLNAGVITYDEQMSYISGNYVIMAGMMNPVPNDEDHSEQHASGFGPFNRSYSKLSGYDNITGYSANVTSSFLEDSFGGTSTVAATSTSSDMTAADADGVVKVKFTLTEACDFSLLGFISSAANGGTASMSIYDTSNSSRVYYNATTWELSDMINIDDQGTLEAGQYLFEGYSNAWAGTNGGAEYSFNFALQAVPEPATLLILGLGVVMLRIKR